MFKIAALGALGALGYAAYYLQKNGKLLDLNEFLETLKSKSGIAPTVQTFQTPY